MLFSLGMSWNGDDTSWEFFLFSRVSDIFWWKKCGQHSKGICLFQLRDYMSCHFFPFSLSLSDWDFCFRAADLNFMEAGRMRCSAAVLLGCENVPHCKRRKSDLKINQMCQTEICFPLKINK